MSIPLIQKPEKDDINTSIIAIKRNIERINMLLGLVDNDSPDLSGFATKQELQDAVTELQPVDEVTVGNMQSVTSNAVANVMGMSLDDESVVDITSQVTKLLGVNSVKVKRKNNLVSIVIDGGYSGSPTSSSQPLVRNLPEKYRPTFYQSFAVCGYLASGNYVYPSRVNFSSDFKDIILSETSMPRSTNLRFGFMYMI
jgi:hypothetical protein